MRSRQCAHRDRVLTFSDRHDQQRDVASASRIRQGRSRFRARRGLLADRHQRRALSRFHFRRRGQCARPLPSASGRGAAGAGARNSGTCRTCSRARTARGSRRGCASRASPTSCSSPIPAPRRWNARSRSRANITPPRAIPSAIASSPSTARFTAARWRRWPRPARRNISKASARRLTVSTRCRSATSRPSRRRSARRPPAS